VAAPAATETATEARSLAFAVASWTPRIATRSRTTARRKSLAVETMRPTHSPVLVVEEVVLGNLDARQK
jgi:hypothetical protein